MLFVHAGEHTYEEIAEILGRARSTIQAGIKEFEQCSPSGIVAASIYALVEKPQR